MSITIIFSITIFIFLSLIYLSMMANSYNQKDYSNYKYYNIISTFCLIIAANIYLFDIDLIKYYLPVLVIATPTFVSFNIFIYKYKYNQMTKRTKLDLVILSLMTTLTLLNTLILLP